MKNAVAVITWVACVLSVGCDSHQGVTTPTGPRVAAVFIAPGAVALRLGSGVSLTARVRDSSERRIDGAVVTWASSNTSVAQVVGGAVIAVGLGTATITATAGGVTGTATITVYTPSVATIMVWPANDTLLTEHHASLLAITYDQVGAQYGQPVTWSSSDATVVTVDSSGRIAAGVPGSAVITVVAGTAKTEVPVTVLLGPPSAPIEGDWTMTLSASPSCRDKLPAAARDRQYFVHFAQTGADFGLTISSPTLQVDNPGEDTGSLVGMAITFVLIGDTGYDTWSTTDLHDSLGDGTRLDFDGIVTGVVSGSVIRATMSGDMELGPEDFNGPIATCRATDHTVTLRR
jgi:hypothetical protein